jgi:hypothetical protein
MAAVGRSRKGSAQEVAATASGLFSRKSHSGTVTRAAKGEAKKVGEVISSGYIPEYEDEDDS